MREVDQAWREEVERTLVGHSWTVKVAGVILGAIIGFCGWGAFFVAVELSKLDARVAAMEARVATLSHQLEARSSK